jgi:hypothetical protein
VNRDSSPAAARNLFCLRSHVLRIAAAVLGCLALWAGAMPAGASVDPWSDAPVPGGDKLIAPITLSLTGEHQPVPHSFFGLSVEANELPTYEAAARLFGRFLSMVRPDDGSRMLLRVGGKSTDAAYWKVAPSGAPPWVYELGDSWLSQLAALVRREDLRVMLDLNLAVHSPAMAAQFAGDAAKALPRGRLVGLGIGNEPDLYHQQLGLQKERINTTLASTPLDWAVGYSPTAYQDDYRSYAQSLSASNPHTPLVGPDTTSSTPSWISALSELTRAGPSMITMHRYAYSSCYKPGSPFYPTVPKLMLTSASAGLAVRLHRALGIATAAGLPLRVTELNSISCGGQAGVADTFATALWAPDALFELMKAGIAGVNWHIRPTLHNAPFHLTSQGFDAMPELYGLALFNQMIGHRSELERLKQANPSRLNLKSWAVRTGKSLKLLLINKGPTPATVQLTGSGLSGRPAEVSLLKARSLTSQTGISLGGRQIGSDARWHGSRQTRPVRARAGLYHFGIRPYSAQLIRLSYP